MSGTRIEPHIPHFRRTYYEHCGAVLPTKPESFVCLFLRERRET